MLIAPRMIRLVRVRLSSIMKAMKIIQVLRIIHTNCLWFGVELVDGLGRSDQLLRRLVGSL
jgi:hypothetical protein